MGDFLEFTKHDKTFILPYFMDAFKRHAFREHDEGWVFVITSWH